MLPVMLAGGGTSIVVVSFVSLADELPTRALDMGVDCVQFKPSMSDSRECRSRAACHRQRGHREQCGYLTADPHGRMSHDYNRHREQSELRRAQESESMRLPRHHVDGDNATGAGGRVPAVDARGGCQDEPRLYYKAQRPAPRGLY